MTPSEPSPFSAVRRTGPAPEPGAAPGGWTGLTGSDRASGQLYVPAGTGTAVRLVVLFHGAGQSPRSVATILEQPAREHGFALLVPRASGTTWDAIGGQAGPDLRKLGILVAAAALRVPLDPGRIAVAGFSDGASYALGVGLAFGEQVSEIIAFSPGFVAAAGRPSGKPRIFISHGRGDAVLPIDLASRSLIPPLLQGGYDIEYHEFDGGHTAPPAIVRTATGWLLDPRT